MRLEEALNFWTQAYKGGRVSQAYIVVGPPRGSGMEFTERCLQTMYCSKEDEFCGVCSSCVQISAHTFPDILWIESQMKSRKISVEQVRNLQKQIYQTSFAGGWKVCVIVGADRLGDQAANAFLKTLEEPPAKTIFFLLTESPQFLLPTINSRCQRVVVSSASDDLHPEWYNDVMDILSGGDLAEDVTCSHSLIASFSIAERMERILKQFKDDAQRIEQEVAAEEAVEEGNATIDARVNARFKEMRTLVMRIVLSWYRDILLLMCGSDVNIISNKQYIDSIKSKAKTLSYKDALHNIEIVAEMNRKLEGNMLQRMVLANGFSRIKS